MGSDGHDMALGERREKLNGGVTEMNGEYCKLRSLLFLVSKLRPAIKFSREE